MPGSKEVAAVKLRVRLNYCGARDSWLPSEALLPKSFHIWKRKSGKRMEVMMTPTQRGLTSICGARNIVVDFWLLKVCVCFNVSATWQKIFLKINSWVKWLFLKESARLNFSKKNNNAGAIIWTGNTLWAGYFPWFSRKNAQFQA